MVDETRRFARYLADERAAARRYRALADLTDGTRRAALLELAAIEDRHAQHWATLLAERGAPVPGDTHGASDEDRDLLERARSGGLDAVLPELEAGERQAQGVYDDEEFAAAGMADDERVHERVLGSMRGQPAPLAPAGGHDRAGRIPRHGRVDAAGDEVPAEGTIPGEPKAAGLDGARVRELLAEHEPWHRADKSGTLRAAIFGASDGLVSNAALIMGFAGSGVDNAAVAFAGLAGLLAGAFSMAAGEFVSVAGQRDVFTREIRLEQAELADHPQDEARELSLLYQAKGMSPELADEAARRIIADPEVALDTLVREELGLDPNDLGSPLRVAASSFASFAVGAAIPLAPFALMAGSTALLVAILLTTAALLGVGGTVGRLSGAGVVRSAVRQFVVGAAAAAVTYVVGGLVGGSVGIG